MKKIYTTLFAVIAIFNFSYAQSWSGNGTDLYFNTSGKVGIGTTSPVFKLQVNGDISVNSASNYIYTSKIGSYTGDLTVNLGSSGNNLLLMGGKVGIGAASPGALLQVGTRSTAGAANNSTVASFGGSTAAGAAYALTLQNTAANAVGNKTALTFITAGNLSATGQISTIQTKCGEWRK